VLKNLATNKEQLATSKEQSATSEAQERAVPNIPGLSVRNEKCSTTNYRGPDQVGLYVDRDKLHLCYKEIHASWPLEQLQPTLSSAFFNELFLATASGNVLLASRDSSLRLRQIPRPSNDQKSGPAGSSAASSERSSPNQNSVVQSDIIVGGDSYIQYLQPVCISLAIETKEGSCWMVGGLRSTDQFRAESLALESPHLVFLSLLVTFVALALPFLRVRFMGPRERLPVRNVLALGASLLVGGGVAGVCLADLAHYQNLADTLDAQMEAVANRLEDNFNKEIERALLELRSRSDQFRTMPTQGDQVQIEPGMNYPFLQMVSWVDASGQQRTKWTPRLTNTAQINVRTRDYFRRLRTGQGWHRTIQGNDQEYFLESIQSWNTGEHLGMLSIPFCWKEPCSAPKQSAPANGDAQHDGLGIAAMTIRPVSLDRPVLPAGFEFAVIEASGRTLFHSRAERNLEEDFFDEAARNPSLRAVVTARDRRHLDATYSGRASRLFVQPISGVPLILIIVLDKTYLGSLHFEALFLSITLFLSFAFLVLLVVSVIEVWLLRRQLSWAWPDHGQPWKYLLVVTILLLFAFEQLMLLVAAPSLGPPHLSTFVVPFQALGLALATLVGAPNMSTRAGRPIDAWRGGWRLGWTVTIVASLVMLVLHAYIPSATTWWRLPGLQLFVWSLAAALVLRPETFRYLFDRITTGSNVPGHPATGSRLLGLQFFYAASILLTIVIVGVLPGYLLLAGIFPERVQLFARREQLAIAQSLGERAQRLNEIARELPAAYRSSILGADLDIAFPPFLQTSYRAVPGGSWVCAPDADIRPSSRRARASASGRSPVNRPAAESTPGNLLGTWTPCANFSDEWFIPAAPPKLHDVLNQWSVTWMPFLNSVAVDMRDLASEGVEHQWTIAKGPGEARERASSDVLRLQRAAVETPPYEILSHIPESLGRVRLSWILLLVLVIVILGLISYWLGRRLFLVGLSDAEPMGLDERLLALDSNGPCQLLICTRSIDRSIIMGCKKVRYVSLIAVNDCRELNNLTDADEQIMCIDHADHRFDNRRWNQQFLALIEKLVYINKRRVILLASEEPEDLLRMPTDANPEADEMRQRMNRWVRLLGQFVTLRIAESPADTRAALELAIQQHQHSHAAATVGESLESLYALLRRECGSLSRLREIAVQILRRPDFARLSDDALLGEILEMAEGHYRAICAILRDDERLVISQVAAGSVVNPKCEEAIRHLLTRRLLVRDPELRLLNESFGRFLRQAMPADQLAVLERQGTASVWQQLRGSLYFGLAALAAFLFVTQREVFDTASAFVSALTVGGVALVQLVDKLRPVMAKSGSQSTVGPPQR
jgi:hypothetical protein